MIRRGTQWEKILNKTMKLPAVHRTLNPITQSPVEEALTKTHKVKMKRSDLIHSFQSKCSEVEALEKYIWSRKRKLLNYLQ